MNHGNRSFMASRLHLLMKNADDELNLIAVGEAWARARLLRAASHLTPHIWSMQKTRRKMNP